MRTRSHRLLKSVVYDGVCIDHRTEKFSISCIALDADSEAAKAVWMFQMGKLYSGKVCRRISLHRVVLMSEQKFSHHWRHPIYFLSSHFIFCHDVACLSRWLHFQNSVAASRQVYINIFIIAPLICTPSPSVGWMIKEMFLWESVYMPDSGITFWRLHKISTFWWSNECPAVSHTAHLPNLIKKPWANTTSAEVSVSLTHKVTGTMSSMVPELKQKKLLRDSEAAKAAAVAAVAAVKVRWETGSKIRRPQDWKTTCSCGVSAECSRVVVIVTM